ncbi:MAG: hypothetical protein ABSF77_13995 [Spirochaetia bacterium]|jgi:hypothetical protein
MKQHILVCPFEPPLISRLQGQTLVVHVEDVLLIPRVKEQVERHNRLHCIQVISSHPLARLELTPEMKAIPIAAYVPEVGEGGEFYEKLPLLRQLGLQVYLAAIGKTNIRDARILSSLGIATALVMEGVPLDWDAMEDLLVYFAYGKSRHANIEPFNYVISNYSRTSMVDFSSVYFDNPNRYLHVEGDGRIALSAKDAQAGVFIGELDSIDAIADDPRYKERRDKAERFFLEGAGCAYCGAFRVCLGKFSAQRDANPGCEKLFAKLMEISENQKIRDGVVLWQP